MTSEELQQRLEEIKQVQSPEERLSMLAEVKHAIDEANISMRQAYEEAKASLGE